MASESALRAKQVAGAAAVRLVRPGSRIALGTGSTVEAALPELARIDGITVTPTSSAIGNRAREFGIPLVAVSSSYDLYIDGADQVSSEGHVIKGSLGAHVRERSLAAMARRRILVVDSGKLVDALVGPVPIAVIPYFAPVYQSGGSLEHDENGLALIRVDAGDTIVDPPRWDAEMSSRPGVVLTGLFPNSFIDEVIVGYADGRVESKVGKR